MELREYGRIIQRRWWIPVLLTLLVAGLSAIQLRPWNPPPPDEYDVEIRLLLGVVPLADADTTNYDPRYFAWLISEYLVDDFTEVVGSQRFAAGVSQRLATKGIKVPGDSIQGSSTTGKQHRIITLEFSWPDKEEAMSIANAATAELKENASTYFIQLGTADTVIEILDEPFIDEDKNKLRALLEFPLRVLLALLAGLGLAFLVEYLDDSVRSRGDLEALGVSIIGAIPKHQ